MAETIEVYFQPLGQFKGIAYYHQSLLYTNANGDKFLASAGPSGEGPEQPKEMSTEISSAASGKFTSWAYLTRHVDNINDWVELDRQRLVGANASYLVAKADNLVNEWDVIKLALDDIISQKFYYSPVTLNSNSAASTALAAAKIPPLGLELIGQQGMFWSPAADRILPTRFTVANEYSVLASSKLLVPELAAENNPYTAGKTSTPHPDQNAKVSVAQSVRNSKIRMR